jgi:hypothetical protein
MTEEAKRRPFDRFDDYFLDFIWKNPVADCCVPGQLNPLPNSTLAELPYIWPAQADRWIAFQGHHAR